MKDMGSEQPDAGIADAFDKVFTVNQAAKYLGLSPSTLRRFVREGTLWATSMENGALGLRESEIQRFIDRFAAPAQQTELSIIKSEAQRERDETRSLEVLLRAVSRAAITTVLDVENVVDSAA